MLLDVPKYSSTPLSLRSTTITPGARSCSPSSRLDTYTPLHFGALIGTCSQDEDSGSNVLLFVSFLLLDIRESETTAELLNEQGAFPRLVDFIADPRQKEDTLLHRMLMDLLYEMSRVQRIKLDDLRMFCAEVATS